MVATTEMVKHLHDDYYLIDRSLIEYANASFTDKQNFVNPRHASGDNEGMGRGFDATSMNSLREGIRTEGLLHPLIVYSKGKNIGEQKLIIVNGERRNRSIDKLIAENALCYNRQTGEFKPAAQLYANVTCIVLTNPSTEQLYKYAWSSNEGASPIGEAAQVALVRQWRNWGWDDKQICGITNMSITWLKETDQIIGLDQQCWEKFAGGEINRAISLKLCEIGDTEKRLTALSQSCEHAWERLTVIQNNIKGNIIAAKEAEEFAKAQVIDAEMQNSKEKKQKALADVDKAKKKVAKQKQKLKETQDKKPKATIKDLNAVAAKSGLNKADGVIKKLSYAKIDKCWVAPCNVAIKADGKNDQGEEIGIDVEDARLVIQLYKGIEGGEKDIYKLLKAHAKAKALRAVK